MRASNQLKLMPVKLRNRALPRQPLTLTTKWEYSYVGSSYIPPEVTDDDTDQLSGMEVTLDDDDDMEITYNTGLEEEHEETDDIDNITLDD